MPQKSAYILARDQGSVFSYTLRHESGVFEQASGDRKFPRVRSDRTGQEMHICPPETEVVVCVVPPLSSSVSRRRWWEGRRVSPRLLPPSPDTREKTKRTKQHTYLCSQRFLLTDLSGFLPNPWFARRTVRRRLWLLA